jgi:CO/xanthine dehydrogenase FAD-binding subunit
MDLNTVEELLATADPDDWRPGDAWLAGGTVLFSDGSDSLLRLLDITAAGWRPWQVLDAGLELAATCTIAELYELPSGGLPGAVAWPATALIRPCCDAFVASFKIWNTSTVGGNVATALPAGPMTSLLAGLDAVATVLSPGGGRRDLPVAELVTGDGATSLAPGELIRSFLVPRSSLRQRTAFRRLSLSNLGRSAVVLVGRVLPDGAQRLTVTAATVRPIQLTLPAGATAAQLSAALEAAIPGDLYHRDVHGHPAWRRDMTHLLAEEIRGELGALMRP